MSKEKLIPELRFPEFENEGEWEIKTIEDIALSESSSMALNKLELRAKGYPVYGADSIVGYIDEFQQNNKYISIVKDGSGVGRLNLCQSQSSVLGTLACIKSKNEKQYHLDWIYYLLNKVDFTVYVKGAGIPHIYFSDYKKENVPVPHPQEQQKIAACLSSLDELIAAHSQKLDLLKDHKKGLMQNLFPQEGEKVPKYRFKEFEKDGEWEEKKLGEICQLITKGTTPKSFSNNGIRFIKIEAFQESQIIVEKCMFITEDSHHGELKRSILKENDILFAIAGATIGKVNIVKKEILPANTNQALAIIRLKENENHNFIFHILKSQTMLTYIQKSISVGAQPNLNLEQIGSFSFEYPKNPKEQQKIALCLSSLDNLITAQAEKIEQLKLHKKGLMQGLFPKLND